MDPSTSVIVTGVALMKVDHGQARNVSAWRLWCMILLFLANLRRDCL